MREAEATARQDPERMRAAFAAASLAYYDDATAPHRAWVKRRDPRVYYLRLNGLIKIGTTGFLDKRLSSYPPGWVLLATEAGGRELEQARHKQFAGARVATEWFRPVPDLLAHIAELATAST